MELREQCQLIEVSYNETKKKATLTFLDESAGEILEVNFNKQSYENGEFVDDEEKAAKVEGWCKEYFDTTFDNLNSVVGTVKDVYNYDTFNSLWESEYANKFEKDQKGKILICTITSIEDNGNIIVINYTEDATGTLYKSNMSYSKYDEVRKTWFVNPVKKKSTYEKFEEKFGVPVSKGDEIVGKSIMVEVKVAFGTHYYGDIKKPSWSE